MRCEWPAGAAVLLALLGGGAVSCGTTPCGLALVQRIQVPRGGTSVEVPCCGGAVFEDVNLTYEDVEVDLTNSSAPDRVDAFLTTAECGRLFDAYAGTPASPLCPILIGPVPAGGVSQRRTLAPGRYRVFAQARSSNEGPSTFVFDLGIWSDDCRLQRLGPSSVSSS